MTDTPEASRAVRLLVAGAATVALAEAAALGTLVVLDLLDLSSSRVSVGVGVAVFLGACTVALALCAVLLVRGSGAARGPLVLAQLLFLGVAFSSRHADLRWVPATLAGGAIVALACLLAPPVSRAYADVPDEP